MSTRSRSFRAFFTSSVLGRSAALMLFELSHEVGFTVIAAGLRNGSHGKVGSSQQLGCTEQAALDYILTAGDSEGGEIQTVKIGLAHLQVLAYLLDGPVIGGLFVYSAAHFVQLGVMRELLGR